MIKPHGSDKLNPLYVADDAKDFIVRDGILADIAPTLLELLGFAQPAEMTGRSLLEKKR